MRYEWAALPWELLGRRPALITLTYPAAWRAVVADSTMLERHRKTLKERWRRKYGDPIGTWVVEFQPRPTRPVAERLAPHVHLYLGLPEEIGDDEHAALVRRVLERKRMELEFGKYEGRRRTRAPEGEFAGWLLRCWSEIVGTEGSAHRWRGADVMPAFWSDSAEQQADRGRIAEYFYRESGKWQQKTVPDDFGSLAFYGRWGAHRGFRKVERADLLGRAEYVLKRRVLRGVIRARMQAEAVAQRRRPGKYTGPRGMDGLTVFTPYAEQVAERLRQWSAVEAVEYESGRVERLLEKEAAAAARRWRAEEHSRALWVESLGAGDDPYG